MTGLVTEAMLRAAYRATGCPVSEHGPGPRNREFFTQIYLAMHAAAQAGEARSDETTKIGSTRRASTRSRRDAPR